MPFQPDHGVIRWRVHFTSQPEKVFDALATDEGRATFWAEAAPERNGEITFYFLKYEAFSGRILRRARPMTFAVEYFGTIVQFDLANDGRGGTDLTLVASDVDEDIRAEMTAGWVSVLTAMKAAVDHGIDLRNHDPTRTWVDGYADN